MSKELCVKTQKECGYLNFCNDVLTLMKKHKIECVNELETSLKRLEEHDKIFKEYDIDDNWLDIALYVIKSHFPMDTETQLKKLKALEIIKEKKVAINILFMSENAYVYNELYEVVIIPSGTTPKYEWKLTDTEFDTIKEALK